MFRILYARPQTIVLAMTSYAMFGCAYRLDIEIVADAMETELSEDASSIYKDMTMVAESLWKQSTLVTSTTQIVGDTYAMGSPEDVPTAQDSSIIRIVLLAWVLTACIVLVCVATAYVLRRLAIKEQAETGTPESATAVLKYDQTQDDSDEFESDEDAEMLVEEKQEFAKHWCSPEALAKTLDDPNYFSIDLIQPKWSVASVATALRSHGIATHAWSEHALSDLACELSNGQARLCKKGQQLVRILDTVLVFVVYKPENRVLLTSTGPQGKKTLDSDDCFERAIQRRLTAGESLSDCMRIAVYEQIPLDVDGIIRFNSRLMNVRRKVYGDHSAYPGLATLSRMFMFEATVIPAAASDIERLGVKDKLLYAGSRTFVWENINELRDIRKAIRNRKNYSTLNGYRCDLDHALVPITSWNHADLKNTLRKYGVIDPLQNFGMEVAEMLQALNEGRLALGLTTQNVCETPDEDEDRNEGKNRLVCVTEKLSMIVRSSLGQVLVCAPADSSDAQFQLPSLQKFASEHIWLTALRLLWQFSISSDSAFEIDAALLAVVDRVGSSEDCICREFIIGGPIEQKTFGR